MRIAWALITSRYYQADNQKKPSHYLKHKVKKVRHPTLGENGDSSVPGEHCKRRFENSITS